MPMIGQGGHGRFLAIARHGEEECSFRRKMETSVFHCKRFSSKKLRWAVASTREQQRHSGHPALLTDGTGGNIDSTDPEQLFLPGFLFDAFFRYGFPVSEDLTT
jgi:hypothetical protein